MLFTKLILIVGFGAYVCLNYTDAPSYQKKEIPDKSLNANDYPYFASSNRVIFIKSQVDKVLVGMDRDQVLQIMGEPDCVNPVYCGIKGPLRGYLYRYLIQQKCEKGSVKDMAIQGVYIYFNLEDEVIRIYKNYGAEGSQKGPEW